MGVAIGDEEADDDVNKEGELAGDIEEEEVFAESSEETELQGGEEGRVHRP